MSKTILLFTILLGYLSSNAQELSKQKEVGLTFGSLDNFGITFRIGKETSLWRFNVLALSGGRQNQNVDSVDYTYSNNGFSFRIGKEFRKSIVEDLTFRFGVDASFFYSKSENIANDKSVYDYDSSIKTITYEPGVNLVIGLNYTVKNNFIFGAELLPTFQYTMGSRTNKNGPSEVESDITGYTYGLSNTSAVLSIVYQF